MAKSPIVFVVDDDPAVRDALRLLLKSVGIPAQTYANGSEFLAACDPDQPGCVLLDIRLPGMSGLELLGELRTRGILMPVIILTGHADVPLAVRALKAGVVDFLEKPFNDQILLDSVHQALKQDTRLRTEQTRRDELLTRLAGLTSREREVLDHLIRGETTRAIAARCGISPKTVEVHRARILQKTQAESLIELVQLVAEISRLTSRPSSTR